MWTVIYVATNQNTADKVCKILSKEGYLTKIRSVNKKNTIFEILIPEAEAEEARNVLITYNL